VKGKVTEAKKTKEVKVEGKDAKGNGMVQRMGESGRGR
jgi:hypothetical protein